MKNYSNIYNSSFLKFYQKKKILITGHTGFKGSWLTLWLKLLNAKIVGYSMNIPTNPSLFKSLKLINGIKHITGKLEDYKKLKNVIKKYQPEIIFHLAAQPLVKKSYKNPIETFSTNALGSLNLLYASRHSKSLKSIIMITSDKVYENREIKRGYSENDKIKGKDPYSASKSCAEIIINMFCNSYQNKKVKVITFRAGNVIGGGDWSLDRIFPDIIKHSLKNKTLKLRNPNATRPWQHVLEPISAYLYAGLQLNKKKVKKINKEAFNLGPKRNVNKTVLDLVNEAKKYFLNLKIEIKKDKKIQESKLLRLNCNKVKKYLKWSPVLNFHQTINLTSEWYKSYFKNKNNLIKISENQINYYINQGKKNNSSWTK
jgi:CDP-glucose 4,6-dehydratase